MPNTAILFINILTECEMCFIAKENFVLKFARPPPLVQAPIPRTYGVVNDQLTSVVA